MQSILLVFIGGGLGSLSRFGISNLYLKYFQNQFSATIATFSSNVLASLLLGLAWMAIDKGQMNPQFKYLILVGFCGGFSTFSTFSFETMQMLREGLFFAAALNVILSVLLCLAVLYLVMKSAT